MPDNTTSLFSSAEARVTQSLTSAAEKRLIDWLCQRMPRAVTSNWLTAIGVVGGVLTFVAYALSNVDPAWLFVASLGLVINWFGDSLDGSLARYRKAERPQFGYYVDHVTDAVVMALVAIGAGLSPYAGHISTLSILVAYLFLTILTLSEDKVTGMFRLSYNGIGPTEIRIIIILLNVVAFVVPMSNYEWFGVEVKLFDMLLLIATALLIGSGLVHAVQTARRLSLSDPPRQ